MVEVLVPELRPNQTFVLDAANDCYLPSCQ